MPHVQEDPFKRERTPHITLSLQVGSHAKYVKKLLNIKIISVGIWKRSMVEKITNVKETQICKITMSLEDTICLWIVVQQKLAFKHLRGLIEQSEKRYFSLEAGQNMRLMLSNHVSKLYK